MSGYLVGNGTKLYRRSNSLVRSPIYVSVPLVPDSQAYYSVCNVYDHGSPARAFIGSPMNFSEVNCIRAGKEMRRRYLGLTSPVGGIQKWRDASGNLPRFIFWNGLYAPTADRYDTVSSGGAYLQIPAYHFSLPSKYNGCEIESISLAITHGGTIIEYDKADWSRASSNYRPYYTSTCTTEILSSDSQWRGGWPQRFGVFSDLSKEARDMYSDLSDAESVILDNVRSFDDLWYMKDGTKYWKCNTVGPVFGNTYCSYYTDVIPTTYNPWKQYITMSASSCTRFKNNGNSGWFVGIPDVDVSSSDDTNNGDDFPYWSTSYSHRWLCCSYWGFEITVRIKVG